MVDYIVRSVEDVLQREFGVSVSDEGVHVLDPFVGTGTFITRLLQSGLIRPEDLQRKYETELHANDMLLLAYYIAAINIEATYHDLADATEYTPFNGITLTDTLQAAEQARPGRNPLPAQRRAHRAAKQAGHPRVHRQSALVRLQQPPVPDDRQPSEGKLRRTFQYEALVNSLYDPYVKAIRQASDRVQGSAKGASSRS